VPINIPILVAVEQIPFSWVYRPISGKYLYLYKGNTFTLVYTVYSYKNFTFHWLTQSLILSAVLYLLLTVDL
jgi:hypothetical protein